MSKRSHGGARNRFKKLTASEKAAHRVEAMRRKADGLAALPMNRPEIGWNPERRPYPPGFYTYRLIDPRSGNVFYVGKGQRDRAWQHERNVRVGNLAGNRRKVAIIQEIIAEELSVTIDVVAVYQFEADALEHEFRLIDADAALVNISAGMLPDGTSAAALEQRRLRRAAKLAEARERDRQAVTAKKREQLRSRALRAPNAALHTEEINNWIDGLWESGRKLVALQKRTYDPVAKVYRRVEQSGSSSGS